MKITHFKLENIKCFKEVDIPFEDDRGQVRDWSLVVGNNGDGKTTLLRGLALSLCDVSSAGGQILELHGGILRDGVETGSVEVTLKNPEDSKKYKIKTTISLKGNNEIVSQTISDDNSKEIEQTIENKIRKSLFAVGYGAGRPITGTDSYEEYALVDSVYSLFNYEYRLQNAELGIRRIKDSVSGENFEILKNSLKKILMLESEDDIILNKSGLFVKTKRWGERSFNTLSDGYQSLTTVIINFLHWRLQYDSKNCDLTKTSGIFIIDEIEQHLHPRWQRRIIKLLSEQFPNVQFIAATHTPICVLGLNDLKCESQLIKASYVNNHSEVDPPIDMREHYKGYRADQILVSDIFELTSSRSKSIEDKLSRYRDIYLREDDKRTVAEKKEMKEIEEGLKNMPIWDAVVDKKTIDKLTNLLADQSGAGDD